MKTISTVSQVLQKHSQTVSPGLPASLTGTHAIGDGIWQGDLGLEIVKRVPDGYVRVSRPKDKDRQLVPAGGAGSHHRVASLKGVQLWRPEGWGTLPETDLRGPCLVFSAPNAVVHEPGHSRPHGTVFIEVPMIVLCRYQRNLTAEDRSVRALD